MHAILSPLQPVIHNVKLDVSPNTMCGVDIIRVSTLSALQQLKVLSRFSQGQSNRQIENLQQQILYDIPNECIQ